MGRLLIKNGTIVTADAQYRADIYIVGEKIHSIAPNLVRRFPLAFEETIDASGCLIFPGGIDAHTHMELPLKTILSSDTFASGTAAALIGGTTTIIDFANQEKGKTIKAALRDWRRKAEGHALCDYAFHVSVTDFNERTRKEIGECFDEGITSFKIFTAYKGSLMIDDRKIVEVMEEVKNQKGLVLAHAENGDLIERLVEKNRQLKNLSPRFHARSHPAIAEVEATSRLVDLAQFVGCPLYVVHMSSGEALERIAPLLGQAAGRGRARSPVYIETCPQYLLLDDSVYLKKGFEGAKYVLSPPLRETSDQRRLWAGLASGLVSVVATDHCPFTMQQRRLGLNDFSKIPNGVPGVEHRLELLYSEGVEKGRLSLKQFVELTSTNPAKLFGLYPKKGSIAAGFDADLVIFDPNEEHTLSAQTHHMNCDYSIFEGWRVKGRCKSTVLRGQVVARLGKLVRSTSIGNYIPRKRQESQ